MGESVKIIRVWHGKNSFCVELPAGREEAEFRKEVETHCKKLAASVTRKDREAIEEDYRMRYGPPNGSSAERTVAIDESHG